MILCDLTKNKKQETFFYEAIAAVKGLSQQRYLFYGGAVRGGKTFVAITCLAVFCKMFPQSRWLIIRDSFTNLELTTIPSLEKLLPESNTRSIKKYSRSSGNWFVEFQNGSKIILSSESIHHDPQLKWMDGIECNGIFLEQMDGLDEKTFNKSIERIGSWTIANMPKPILLGSFNPAQNWVKEKIYEPYKSGKLKTPYFFLEAFPKDNPYVTDEQWKAWENLDPVSYKVRIEGDWYAYDQQNLFIYTFNEMRNVAKLEADPNEIYYLSFDFNVNPMTCLVCQHNEMREQIMILREIRIENATIYDMCEVLKAEFNPGQIKITGDPRGTARHSLSLSAALNHYAVIVDQLRISERQVELPQAYPAPAEEHNILRLIANSLLCRYPQLYIDEGCKYLLQDIKYITTVNGRREKLKEGKGGHLLDCMLYYFYTYFSNFIEKV